MEEYDERRVTSYLFFAGFDFIIAKLHVIQIIDVRWQ